VLAGCRLTLVWTSLVCQSDTVGLKHIPRYNPSSGVYSNSRDKMRAKLETLRLQFCTKRQVHMSVCAASL
jgi:hypothetical protein